MMVATAYDMEGRITDPAVFFNWWQRRNKNDAQDRRMKRAAISAGLVTVGGGLLLLTEQGRDLRALSFPKRRRRTYP